MKRAIYIKMCLVAVCAVLLTFAATFTISFYTLQAQMRTELEKQANNVTAGYNHAQNKNSFLDSFAHLKSPRITVISENGNVVFDNLVDAATMENHNQRPEVMEARKSGRDQIVRVSGTLDKQTFYYAVRANDGSIVRLAHTTSIVASTFKQTLPLILFLIILIFLLTIFVSGRLTKKIVDPINKLDLDNPLENEIYEELTPLLTKIHKQNSQIKRQVELLDKNKEEFKAITENMAEGMVLFDCQMNIISINRSAINLLQAKHRDYTGLHLVMLTRNTVITESVEKALQGQNSNKVIKTDSAYLELLASPVVTKGRVIGCLLLILDSSAKFTAEQSRKEFTANVSHELKTPLTSISGYAEMITLGLAKEEDVKEFANKIYNEAKRLLSLVEDILELSKLDEKDEMKVDVESKPINLRKICERVLERLALPAQTKNVSFTLEGREIYVVGDGQMLEELVYNLCDNGVKYNVENGQVKITLGQEQGRPHLTVADTGVGIPQKELARIFERFYRVDKSRSQEVGGTGLGLSIVKHIAIYHGAELEVKSKLGQGSKFTVKFPSPKKVRT
jgi:two-component system phosphate regulon sensor histidine kinase PhoR